jgi:hypothetical protein
MATYKAYENVLITDIERLQSHVPQEYKTKIMLRGVHEPLWFRGTLRNHAVGARVTIIFEVIYLMNDGSTQNWIHLLGTDSLESLQNKWLAGESMCRVEQK